MILPLLFALPADAAEPAVESGVALCYNLDYDTFLYEKGADLSVSPAAFVKLMTCLLAYEYRAGAGNVSVTVTGTMLSNAGGTTMRLKEGEVIAFDDLLKGLVINNANDAAYAIANTVSENTTRFVEKMNARAKELGMKNTYYSNPTGTDAAGQTTTLRDMLLLCKALYRENDFMVLSSTSKVSVPPTNMTDERSYTNKNGLIPYSYVVDYYLEDTRGMIAGYTANAGYCVAATRTHGGRTNFVLVSGGTDASSSQNGGKVSSYYDAKRLFDYAEKEFAPVELISKGACVCEKKVTLASDTDHVLLVSDGALPVLLPKDYDRSKIRSEVSTDAESYAAPVAKGAVLGTARYFYGDNEIGNVNLVAQTGVSRSVLLAFWSGVTRFFSKGPAKAALIAVIGAIVLYFAWQIVAVLRQNAHHNRDLREAIRQIEEEENERMRAVRLKEKAARRERRLRHRGFLKESFRAFSGDIEFREPPTKKKPQNAPPRRGVAKVPEKYRNPSAPGRTSAPARQEQNGRRPASGDRPARPQSDRRPAPPNAGNTRRDAETYRVRRTPPKNN